MAKLTWQVIETNGGMLELYVFDRDKVIYYADGYEYQGSQLREEIEALQAGEDPRDGWEMPQWVIDEDHDIQTIYDELTKHEHGWQVIADQDGIYPDRMGAAGREAFGIVSE